MQPQTLLWRRRLSIILLTQRLLRWQMPHRRSQPPRLTSLHPQSQLLHQLHLRSHLVANPLRLVAAGRHLLVLALLRQAPIARSPTLLEASERLRRLRGTAALTPVALATRFCQLRLQLQDQLSRWRRFPFREAVASLSARAV